MYNNQHGIYRLRLIWLAKIQTIKKLIVLNVKQVQADIQNSLNGIQSE